jgi:hypothetical protein
VQKYLSLSYKKALFLSIGKIFRGATQTFHFVKCFRDPLGAFKGLRPLSPQEKIQFRNNSIIYDIIPPHFFFSETWDNITAR